MIALLVLIYVTFISLGIPDSLLGAAWPAIRLEMGVPVAFAGIISPLTACGNVAASFLSARMVARFGTARVTAFGVVLTASGLLGFSAARAFPLFLVCAIPMGFGAGAIDAALNNFVALHYKARHMNWLHCFWGVGATLGSAVIGAVLAATNNWRVGYSSIGLAQGVLAAALFCSLPAWKKAVGKNTAADKPRLLSVREVARVPLAIPVFLSLFCCAGAESTMALWGASFLVSVRGIPQDVAASWASVFFLGITLGRFVAGLLSVKWNNAQMIRIGAGCALTGILLLLFPFPGWLPPVAFFLVGTGFAPLFPAMLHETPRIFGGTASQSIMGMQMAIAYVGMILLPPLFGALSQGAGMPLFPWYLTAIMAALCVTREYAQKKASARKLS